MFSLVFEAEPSRTARALRLSIPNAEHASGNENKGSPSTTTIRIVDPLNTRASGSLGTVVDVVIADADVDVGTRVFMARI
jgi:hypothetical protein